MSRPTSGRIAGDPQNSAGEQRFVLLGLPDRRQLLAVMLAERGAAIRRAGAGAGGRLDGHLVQGHVDGTGEVAALEGTELAAAVIPHTYQHTNLHRRRAGERVNLECDILAKYVEKLLGRGAGGVTADRLRELGY